MQLLLLLELPPPSVLLLHASLWHRGCCAQHKAAQRLQKAELSLIAAC
jgi:hypothetical protein